METTLYIILGFLVILLVGVILGKLLKAIRIRNEMADHVNAGKRAVFLDLRKQRDDLQALVNKSAETIRRLESDMEGKDVLLREANFTVNALQGELVKLRENERNTIDEKIRVLRNFQFWLGSITPAPNRMESIAEIDRQIGDLKTERRKLNTP